MTPEEFETVAAYVKNAIAADEKAVKSHDEMPQSFWLMRVMAALGQAAGTKNIHRARFLAFMAQVAAIAMRSMLHELESFGYLPDEEA